MKRGEFTPRSPGEAGTAIVLKRVQLQTPSEMALLPAAAEEGEGEEEEQFRPLPNCR